MSGDDLEHGPASPFARVAQRFDQVRDEARRVDLDRLRGAVREVDELLQLPACEARVDLQL